MDPHTGRNVWTRLDPVALPTAETRRDWAIRKSKEIARESMEIELGGPRRVRKPLGDAVADYFTAAKNRLEPGTIELYEGAAALLKAWAAREGVTTTDALISAKLPGLRDFLIAQRKQGLARGGKRGQRRPTREKLSPSTVNSQLRAIKTILNDLRIRGIVPLSRDAISDGLKPLNVPRDAPAFLRAEECSGLLKAALEHDAATFAETRDEHAGRGEKGTTLRYGAIAPFVALVLLTGMRSNEARTLRWSAIDLDAINGDDKVVGEIRLTAKDTKTKQARIVTLEVAPSLRSLLKMIKGRADGPYVFGGHKHMTEALALAARRRLVTNHSAPKSFTWQVLRSTCGTYLTNAPGIFGAASAYRSAKQLGHSVLVAEKHYAGLISISREAKTLEVAMGISTVLRELLKVSA